MPYAGASYLLDKLVGARMCGGTRMPKGGMPDDQVRRIVDWFCAGALDD